MEITGRIIQILPEVGGVSKAGNEWKKQEYILETHDNPYPKKICFQIFGADRIAQAAIQAGEELVVSIDIDSREYQGRWYTSINAWKVDRPVSTPQEGVIGATDPMAPMDAPAAATPVAPDFGPANPIDDLPF